MRVDTVDTLKNIAMSCAKYIEKRLIFLRATMKNVTNPFSSTSLKIAKLFEQLYKHLIFMQDCTLKHVQCMV